MAAALGIAAFFVATWVAPAPIEVDYTPLKQTAKDAEQMADIQRTLDDIHRKIKNLNGECR